MGGEVVVHVEVGALGVEDLWGWMVLVFVVCVCVCGRIGGGGLTEELAAGIVKVFGGVGLV